MDKFRRVLDDNISLSESEASSDTRDSSTAGNRWLLSLIRTMRHQKRSVRRAFIAIAIIVPIVVVATIIISILIGSHVIAIAEGK